MDATLSTLAMNRSPANAVKVLGIAHVIVGVTKYRRQLRGMLSDGLFNSVREDSQRATALWFLMVAPPLWLSGHLLRRAEADADLQAQRVAGSILIATGLLGCAVLPKSPFVALIGVGAASASGRASRNRPSSRSAGRPLDAHRPDSRSLHSASRRGN